MHEQRKDKDFENNFLNIYRYCNLVRKQELILATFKYYTEYEKNIYYFG